MIRPIVLLVLIASLTIAQEVRPKRARLPKWDKFPAHIFFRDAFREGLVGDRPAVLGGTSSAKATTNPSASQTAPTASNQSWSGVVSATTLEDSIKALQIDLQKSVTTPGRFSSGGYRTVRRQFSELATLFAVISEYDKQVRWKEDAPLARDLFARAASNTKVSSIQAFNESKQRKFDLEELVRGGTLDSSRPVEEQNNWENIVDRSPLMQRLKTSHEERVAVWTSNEQEFTRNIDRTKREAELLRMFAVVMTKDGMEDAGDDDYENYCKQLKTAAGSLLQAVREKDANAARKASSDIGKSCSACHEDYRG